MNIRLPINYIQIYKKNKSNDFCQHFIKISSFQIVYSQTSAILTGTINRDKGDELFFGIANSLTNSQKKPEWSTIRVKTDVFVLNFLCFNDFGQYVSIWY